LVLGELAEVVVEGGGAAAVEPGPEGRLADGRALGIAHADVVVGRPRDHVDVRVEPRNGHITPYLVIVCVDATHGFCTVFLMLSGSPRPHYLLSDASRPDARGS